MQIIKNNDRTIGGKMTFLGERGYSYKGKIKNRNYNCGMNVSSDYGIQIGNYPDGSGDYTGGIHICPNCGAPTFFPLITSEQYPGIKLGNDIKGLSENLEKIYGEARECFKNRCYTSVVLICRKILMHLACELGAEKGKTFIQYVNFLFESHYISPKSKDWVDHIREKGNEANHEISICDEKSAKQLIMFIEMLLKTNYEYPDLVK
jgi:hypothetical protein